VKILTRCPSGISDVTELERLAYKMSRPQSEPPAKGYRTTQEWMKIWGKSNTRTRVALKTLTDLGDMDRKYFKGEVVGGRVRMVPHWKLL